MEEEGPRGDMTIQSGLSNSTESIDSMKALTAAIEAANAQVSAFVFFFLFCEGVCWSCTNQHLLSPVNSLQRNSHPKEFPNFVKTLVFFYCNVLNVCCSCVGPWTSQSTCQ